MIWVLLAILLALAVFFPLIGFAAKPAEVHRRDADIALYRRQLAELDRDFENGLIGEEECNAARTEVERRILDAGAAPVSQHQLVLRPGFRVFVFIIGTMGFAIALYQYLGSPDLPGQPMATRAAPVEARPDGAPDMATLLDELEARMADNPDRLDGWVLLARTALRAGEPARSARAFKRAIALDDQNADFHAGLGEALVRVSGGRVSPAAELAFQDALARNADHPTAHFFKGLLHAQNNRPEEALAVWQALEMRAPADAPWLGGLRTQIARIKARLNPAEDGAETPAVAPRRLSEGEITAAAQMSPQERRAMISSMVERLASRLEENPDDFQSWLRLANAYKILGDETSAKKALLKARAVAPAERIEEIDRHLHILNN